MEPRTDTVNTKDWLEASRGIKLTTPIESYAPTLSIRGNPFSGQNFYDAFRRTSVAFLRSMTAPDLSTLTPDERDLYLYNLQNRGPEPEDAILASSDILPKLLAQAMQKPPSVDWERYLDEL